MSIYICTHKKYDFPDIEGYIPVQAGAADSSEDMGYLKDNTGDNISYKNRSYCELTVLYYIWKNISDDIVGLVHYRRFFFDRPFLFNKKILPFAEAERLLTDSDIILPDKWYSFKSICDHYKKYHNVRDLEMCREIIAEKYQDYIPSFDRVMKQKNLYRYNMFIMKKADFDSYMNWLFDITSELEKNIDENEYNDYNKRVYGFLSERLFNVWIIKNNLKICERRVLNKEESKLSILRHILANQIKKISSIF